MRLLILGLALGATPAAADVLDGRWRAPVNNAVVEIAPCGSAKCGVVVSSDHLAREPDAVDINNKDKAQRGRRVKGLRMLYGFTGGPTEWKGGRVYNPADGGTYSGTIRVTGPNEITLRGCIVYPLCKTQRWTRVG